MNRFIGLALIGLLVAFAANAADVTGCSVRKGLYEAWVSPAHRATHSAPNSGALVASSQPALDASSAEEIGNEYQSFFQCLSDAAIPAGDADGSSLCKAAAPDRMATLACQVALYIKTGRTSPKELIDILPATKKGAEI